MNKLQDFVYCSLICALFDCLLQLLGLSLSNRIPEAPFEFTMTLYDLLIHYDVYCIMYLRKEEEDKAVKPQGKGTGRARHCDGTYTGIAASIILDAYYYYHDTFLYATDNIKFNVY